MTPVPPFAIGSDVWPGVAKLIEEKDELGQVLGKIMAFPEGGRHPDGGEPLESRLAGELADLLAAVDYLRAHSRGLVPWRDFIEERRREKFERFQRWDYEARAAALQGTEQR